MALPVITNNSPGAGSIAWSAFGIQFGGVSYSVAAGNSAQKYVWWAYNGGTPSIQASNAMPTLTENDFLLFLNKSGIGLLVDATQVIDGSLIVSQSILADGIGANQITTEKLDANAVTADKIAANAVTANNIAANAVTANNIAAGAITAEKLSIGAVGDNMVLNGSFEDGVQGFEIVSSGTGAVADVVTGVSSSGANALRLVRGTAANLEVAQDAAHYIPVTSVAGRKWYVACRAGAGSALASGFYLRVYWYQANKVTAASTASVDVHANKALTTAWSVFEGSVTPPANARYMRIAVINALSGSTMYVDEITAHEVVMSAQIGDGQIIAAKVAANAITANAIAANAVTANKIAATAIDGMVITGPTIRTAASGQRVQLDTTGLRTFNASSVETSKLEASSGGMRLNGSLLLGSQGALGLPPQISGDAYRPGLEFTHPTLGAAQASGEYSGSTASLSSHALASNQMGNWSASTTPSESRIEMDARDLDGPFPRFGASIVRSIDKTLKIENPEGPLILTTSRSSPLAESSIIIGTADENSVEVRATNVDFNGGFGENAVVKVNGYAIPTEEIINLALTTNLTLVSGTTLHESSWLRKRSDGYVYGTLAFYRAAGFTSGATFATLGVGLRPNGGDQLPGVMWGAGAPGRCHFQMGGAANGVLIVWSPPANTQYVSAKVAFTV